MQTILTAVRTAVTYVKRVLRAVVLALRSRGLLAPTALPAGVRLTTYNIGRGAKGDKGARAATLDRVAATIADERPDVVALQELHEPDVPVIVAALRHAHGLDYHAEFAASLTAEAMQSRVAKARAGEDFDEAFWAGRDSAFGVALLSRAPLEEVRVERLPGSGEPRVALIARTDADGRAVTVIATHLATATRRAERDEQTHAVVELAEAVDGPVVLAGDLNQEPDEVAAVLAARTASLGARVGSLLAATDPATPTLGLRAIDHVLVGGDVTVVGATVGDRGVSDHRPVTVALRL